jgi:hypothetical protein
VGPLGSSAPRWTGQQTVGRNITWNWTCVIALKITDPSSHQSGWPTWKIKTVIVIQRNITSGHLLQKGQDTKTNWPTDYWSQYNLNLSLNLNCWKCSAWKTRFSTPLAIFQGAQRSENCIRLSIFHTFTIILQNYAGNEQTSYEIMKTEMSAI